jgi:uncharacterized protein (DUF2249 family)
MLTINANTKIAAILKSHPEALEAIISISPKFNKLRNPLLRKVMAARTSIKTAGKISGCGVEAFFDKLEPLGFAIDRSLNDVDLEAENTRVPAFVHNMEPEKTVTLDVRPIIEGGNDPFNTITAEIKRLPEGFVLELINSFEPVPLIGILSKQGFKHFVDTQLEGIVTTYFFKPHGTKKIEAPQVSSDGNWEQILKQYNDHLLEVDVRHLEMPQPMLTILAKLENIQPDQALFVYHKRIPVFLLPELKERNFDYRINEIADGEVQLLIFKA